MPFTFPTTSLVQVMVPVTATRNGAAVDPTATTVSMAFLTSPPQTASPAPGDWKTASWETNSVAGPDRYIAKCLVGTTGAVVLSAGTYFVWIKIVDSPEIPAIYSGVVRVTP